MEESESLPTQVTCNHQYCGWTAGSMGLERQCPLCGKIDIRDKE